MGNCLSKYPLKLEKEGFRRRGSSFQKGHKLEEKARSLGFYVVNKTTILTPVNDRFPAQAFNLKVFKLSAYSEPKDWWNVSAIEM